MRKLKKLLIILGIILAIFLLKTAFFSDNKKIGYFLSNQKKNNFNKIYNKALEKLPKPNKTVDITTKYGTVRVYYFTYTKNKNNTPIVLLHGRSASTPMWEPNLLYLMAKRPVYSIDLLGEPGMSEQKKAIKTNKHQAEWLAEVIKKLKVNKIHLVGSSIGGYLAMNLTYYNPAKISSVSLLDSPFIFVPISLKVIIISIPASIPLIPSTIRNKMLSYISGEIDVNKDDPTAKLIEAGMRTYKIKLPQPKQFTHAKLKTIKVPVLALMAEKSVMHDSNPAVKTGKKFVKNIIIKNWPNATHAINGEYAKEVSDEILNFTENNY